MYAIYVNAKEKDYARMLVDGIKTIETRTRDVFKPIWANSLTGGEPVLVVRTGKGKAEALG